MPSAVSIIKREASKDFLFELLRYPYAKIKEPSARLIIKTQEITHTEAVYIL